jgi:hypothetical protein
MTIIRPPVTGDMSLNSWMDQVTKAVTLASQSAGAIATAEQLSRGQSPVNALTIVLYKEYTSSTLPLSEYIDVQTTYEYSTGILTNNNTQSTEDYSGWSRSIPDIANGNYIFACQVNIADTAPEEVIGSTDWSTPVLIFKSEDVIGVRVATNNGTALRGGSLSSTTLKAVVTKNGVDADDQSHNAYKYKWTIPSGEVICVDSSRNVINSGESPMVANGVEGALYCQIGTPASSSEPSDIHGSLLREITIGSEDVDKAQLIQLEVKDIS